MAPTIRHGLDNGAVIADRISSFVKTITGFSEHFGPISEDFFGNLVAPQGLHLFRNDQHRVLNGVDDIGLETKPLFSLPLQPLDFPRRIAGYCPGSTT